MTTQPGRGVPIGSAFHAGHGDFVDEDHAGRHEEPRLTVAAVASRLGVAPATLRTWDRRYGLGPSGHTSGRHRRYGSKDIARLELMQRALLRGASPADAARYALSVPLPAAPQSVERAAARPVGVELLVSGGRSGAAEDYEFEDDDPPLLISGGDGGSLGIGPRGRQGGRGLKLPGACRTARGLSRAALAMDADAIQQVLAKALAEDGVVPTWDEVIRPVLCALAERWEHAGVGVEIERLLSEEIIVALSRVIALAPPPRNPRPVLLACVPEEQHSLPLYPLSCSLALNGVSVRRLGASLPIDALVAAARRLAPAAVVLWAHLPRNADPSVFDALPKTRQRTRLFVGGPGWAAIDLPRHVQYLDDLSSGTERILRAVLPGV
ncbi:MerR HTH family regulatory protein [Allokutzneria albata]|uniref:MerR HTH family regulatory protein n=1 Tax=Allokutzneria albata TaxID=211114 RepID=A0A1G9YXQ8_ALLAB|nr:MerR HTH family regulatory protein [Allokutzneria albata]